MADDLVRRLREAHANSTQRILGSDIFEAAARLIEQQAASLAAKDMEISCHRQMADKNYRMWADEKARSDQAERALAEAACLRAADEWHEDLGDVLWWRIGDEGKPLETPWVGSPLSCGYTVEAHTTTRIISQINQDSDPEPTIERISVGGWIDDYFTHFSEIPRAFVAQHGSDSREGK